MCCTIECQIISIMAAILGGGTCACCCLTHFNTSTSFRSLRNRCSVYPQKEVKSINLKLTKKMVIIQSPIPDSFMIGIPIDESNDLKKKILYS